MGSFFSSYCFSKMQEQSKSGRHVRNINMSEHGVTNLNKNSDGPATRRQKHDLDTRLTPKDIKNYDNINDVGKCNF